MNSRVKSMQHVNYKGFYYYYHYYYYKTTRHIKILSARQSSSGIVHKCWSSGLFFTATVIQYYQYYMDLQGKFRFK